MKYIKTYEHEEEGKYWLLPTDDRFYKSLKKIKCDDNYIQILLSLKIKEPFIFIGCNINIPVNKSNNGWGWNKYEGKKYDKWYKGYGYKFMGTVNMDYESEIIANKYNI